MIASVGFTTKKILRSFSNDETPASMKTSLEHLPKNKQEEIYLIKEIILSRAPAEMIILFGPLGSFKRKGTVTANHRSLKLLSAYFLDVE